MYNRKRKPCPHPKPHPRPARWFFVTHHQLEERLEPIEIVQHSAEVVATGLAARVAVLEAKVVEQQAQIDALAAIIS